MTFRWAVLVRCCTLAVLTWVLSSCASGGVSPETFPVFPPPPDTARFQFLTRITSLDDLRGGGGRSIIGWLTGSRKKPSTVAIIRPFGLASDAGRIYVCDVGLPGVAEIDLTARTMHQIVSPTLTQPTSCDRDPATGNLYVVDVRRGDVVILGRNGTFAGAISEGLRSPGAVAVRDGRVLVTDLVSKQVHVYDAASGKHLFTFPRPDAPSDSGGLMRPMSIAVADDEVFVSDQVGRRVQVYATDGRYLRQIGSPGDGFGQFDVPKGVAVDRSGLVYVADFYFGNVQVFNREGRLLTLIAGGGYRGPGYLGGPMDVIIDYDNLDYFRKYVQPRFELKYLVMITNQLSPDKLTIYGFVIPRGTGGGKP